MIGDVVSTEFMPEESRFCNRMNKFINFVKKEVVLCVALVLAVVSAFIIPPDAEYIGYIDFHTLAILFCLMGVMAGFRYIGMFQWIAGKLLKKVQKPSGIVMLLVMLCFFFSMLITNDVALITFVPFTFVVGKMLGEKIYRSMVLPTVVLQTIAANLGSMLTPIGNPQNLYLYGLSSMSLVDFVKIMLPYSVASLVLLVVCCVVLGRRLEKGEASEQMDSQGSEAHDAAAAGEVSGAVGKSGQVTSLGQGLTPRDRKGSLVIYLVLFVMCLLTVAQILPLWITFVAVLIGIVLTAYKELAHIDYALLLTFVAFFVFIGNMGRIPAFANLLQSLIMGNEELVAILASQCISNVPAALLLSGFTTDVPALMVGTNLGGLGTLIASMASLISYKYVVAECATNEIPGGKGKYFLLFTVSNICFLIALVVLYLCI